MSVDPGARRRVTRGGGFDATAAMSRVSARTDFAPGTRGPSLGVRPARRLTP